MDNKRFRPFVDKLFWIIAIPTLILLACVTALLFFYPAPVAIVVTVLVDLVTIYLLVSPLFGYVELREKSVYIRFGLILTREIPYQRIRGVVRERKWYSDSMLSLKNSFEHINIKYNTFDIATISVVDNDTFVEELNSRLSGK